MAHNIEASIISPIYNNAYIIRRVIEGFLKQSVSKDHFEIIVIDDCSTDHPEKEIADFIANGTVIFIRNPKNGGPAYSRNSGINRATGKVIIFSDGDAIPDTHFIEEHLKFHQTNPQPYAAALGDLKNPLDMTITPLMMLGNAVENWDSTPYLKTELYNWTGFQTANFSLKANFLGSDRFNVQTFQGAGFEDTELGYRLARRGLKIQFLPSAFSYHYHFRSPDQYLKKTVNYGKSFYRWITICNEQEKDLLNDRYNSLLDRKKLLSLKNLKELLRRICVNDLTAPLIIAAAKTCEKLDERKSVFLYNKLYKYLFLKGYRQSEKEMRG
ncbi:MAG: glycosyltransferase family 2 protein [Candidatus Omnitrophica bacterium]|nr:glycosyltransferase family 2 protein [Candidatus Omnitrophota bacterium]